MSASSRGSRHPLLAFLGSLALLFGLFGASAAYASDEGEAPESTSLERVRAYVQPAVVYLGLEYTGYVYDAFNKRYLGDGGGAPFTVKGQCTGFVISPDGHIATAGHCVDASEGAADALKQAAAEWALQNNYYQRQGLTIQQILGFNNYVIVDEKGDRADPDVKAFAGWGVSASGVASGQSKPARIVSFTPFDESDAALLKIDAKNLHSVRLSDTELEVGQEIVAIGYPGSVDKVTDLDYAPSYKDGTVSSEKTRDGGLYQVFEVSAAVSGGMSGGPVVNAKGQVVGFNSFGINPQVETQAFNFARPVSVISELLSAAGAKNELGSVAKAYNTGLDAYFAGDKEVAVANLEKVLDATPNHELATDFLAKAKKLPDPPSFPWLLVVIGGLLIVAVIVVVLVLTLLLRRRSKGRKAAMAPAGYAYAGATALPPAPGYQQPPGSFPAPPSPGPQPPYAPQAPQPPESQPAYPQQPREPYPGPQAPQPTEQPPYEPPRQAEPQQQPSGPPPQAPQPPQSPPNGQPSDPHGATAPLQPAYCRSCGHKLEPAERYCPNCGTAAF